MADQSDSCQYCGGAGMKLVEIETPGPDGKPRIRDASRPCICTLNRYVSSRHDKLTGVVDATPEDCIEVGKKLQFSDYLFFGSESKFLYIAKAFIILHYHYNRRFSVVSGADIAEKFAMAQADGVIPTVSVLTDFDLVCLLCVSKINNKAITPGSYEMVANRQRAKKATWIFAADEQALRNSKEYSSEVFSENLGTLIDDFPKVLVDSHFSCGGYGSKMKTPTSTKRQRVNDNLANL